LTASLDAIPPLEGPKVGAPRSDLRPVVASGAARAVVLPLAAVLNLGETAILVNAVGPGSYGAVLLVGTFFQLLPFADLGVGAAVTRAVAASRFPASDWHVAKVMRRSLRMLVGSSVVLIALALALGASGAWTPILGLKNQIAHADLVATLTLVLFAAQLPLALGQRVLLGAGKNHIAVIATIVQPMAAFLLAVALRIGHAPPGSYVLIFPVALIVTSSVMAVIAQRLTGIRPTFRGPANASVLPVAVPMFLMTVGLPIGLQSDKLVLSHRLPEALSQYALTFQLYAPAWYVLSTAAFALLPVFTHRRAVGLTYRRLWVQATAIFAGLAALGGAAFVVGAPLVTHVITRGRIHPELSLRVAFASLLLVQTTGLVSGMLLNDPRELRFQAFCVLNMMIANLGLSWVLIGPLGVAGPVIASVVSMGVLMVLPAWVAAARTAR
jgi:hypothetical protein